MNRYKKPGVLASIAGLLSLTLCSLSYGANWFEVRVVDKQSGAPVERAAVCLGIPARPDQFGARRTALDGVVRFHNLPLNSLVLTASQRGYRGKQQRIEPLSGNRVVVLSLVPGGGGPVCTAAVADKPAQVTGGLEVTSVQVVADSSSSSDGRVIVKVAVSGEADQVRIAESKDFAGSEWKDLQPQNHYTLSPGQGVKQLYVQVRRLVKTKGASIEALSPVDMVLYRYSPRGKR